MTYGTGLYPNWVVKLFSLSTCLFLATLASAQSMHVDEIEYAVSLSPTYAIYTGDPGARALLFDFPHLSVHYRGLVLSGIMLYGKGTSAGAMRYNGQGFLTSEEGFTHVQFQGRIGFTAARHRYGRVMPFIGLSSLSLKREREGQLRESLKFLPDYTFGVEGLYDLDAMFRMRTMIRNVVILKHFVRAEFGYTIMDPGTTGQPRTELPHGLVTVNLGWGFFISTEGR